MLKNSTVSEHAGMDDCAALPYSLFREAIQTLPRASEVRCMLLMLALTGMRVQELAVLRVDNIVDNAILWPLGKNQRGWRREVLPDWYRAELGHFRANNRVPTRYVFGMTPEHLRRYFNKFVRPRLSHSWRLRRRTLTTGIVTEQQYRYQLSSLRKSFCTTVFYREYRHWGDIHVALLFAQKRFCHKSERITAMHYLKEFSSCEVERWDSFLSESVPFSSQMRIMQFF